MESYTTIKRRALFEYEDRKSLFIAEAAPVETEQDAITFVESIKRKYPDANHHVYAYILRDNYIARFTDDREPQGTAGLPVLDAMRKRSITNAAVVVVRYFGGTLLGTGGLVKAYSTSAVGALNSAEVITYDTYITYEINCSYSDFQRLGAPLSSAGFRQENIEYSDAVKLIGSVRHDLSDGMLDAITQASSGRAFAKKIKEKYDF